LPQACLGKLIVLYIQMAPERRYCELHNDRPKTTETSAIRVS
jgi:hypothetical protein